MKKVWIMVYNDHFGYMEVEVLKDTKNAVKTIFGLYDKKNVYFREIDIINAIIAQRADQLSFYRECVKNEEKRINQLIERKKII